MRSTRYRYQTRGEEGIESGFTLIELLIVIVVLGILAAVTVFALSGVSSTSVGAACTSDASAVNTAIVAYEASNGGAVPTQLQLTSAGNGGPYLQSWPSSTHYTITIAAGQVNVEGNTGQGAHPWTAGPPYAMYCSSTTYVK